MRSPPALSKQPEDERRTAFEFLARVHARLMDEGVGWYKDGVFEVSRCALRRRRVPGACLAFWERHAVPLLWHVLNQVAPALYEENPWVQEVLGLDAERLSYLREFNAPGQPLLDYFGVDSLEPDRRIVDINSRPGVIGYLDEIRDAYSSARDEVRETPSFNEALFTRLRAYSRNGLAVVLPERGSRFGDKRRIAEVASRYVPDATVYKLSELGTLAERELPGVALLTMIPTQILDDREKFSGLRALARKGVPIINRPDSFLGTSKTMMHLLAWSPTVERDVLALLDTDSERARAKRALLQALFVPSVLIHAGAAYTAHGTCDAGEYLATRPRKGCVVKHGHTSGGWGVHHGAHTTRGRWQALLERVRRGGTWVVEEAQEHEREEIWGLVPEGSDGEDVGPGDGIDVQRLRARILYRTYAVRGETPVFQEIFAAREWKVNAAGWSMPAEYGDS
ncbi:MAG: hypothetical protein GWN84_24115 [Gammaproteobacteria bacterium]|nr:hypothetical protein [Gammaproteobacteria bacterium]NIR85669.1 hypothetical protein [Gammaproteobacteria bacterium]NIR90157.1 hypothetical protein [Gammaproteobacteria bacterium]NIU06803.1 hypothetical protein [Gammaproteobacteria bacterium]NIV53736.1 hypothetical protein [Gammaproteobacteria bacterium]